jgi:hypothetical protein
LLPVLLPLMRGADGKALAGPQDTLLARLQLF